ncbi:MAG: hypothetical protein ACLFN8_01075 [Candidatus Woesearchaeota archaeon]
MLGKFLCQIGFHKWSRPIRTSQGFTSNVYEVKKKCSRCKKVKMWVESK